MSKHQYTHPVIVRTIANKYDLFYLSAKDCLEDNEIVLCLDTSQYYVAFYSEYNLPNYNFMQLSPPLTNEVCDLCGAADDINDRIELTVITVKKPKNLIHPEIIDKRKYYRLADMTQEKRICKSCKEIIMNVGRS